MSALLKSIEQFAWFCKKADVVGMPRLSISFDNERDAAHFEAEVRREFQGSIIPTWLHSFDEFTVYGVHIRIMK